MKLTDKVPSARARSQHRWCRAHGARQTVPIRVLTDLLGLHGATAHRAEAAGAGWTVYAASQWIELSTQVREVPRS